MCVRVGSVGVWVLPPGAYDTCGIAAPHQRFCPVKWNVNERIQNRRFPPLAFTEYGKGEKIPCRRLIKLLLFVRGAVQEITHNR